LLYGYDLGVIAQVIASESFKSTFKPTDNETGAVVSVFTGGAFFGAGFAGPMGDKLGRRMTILVGAVVFCLGGALQTGAQGLSYLYAGRLIAGLGVGILCMIIPVYQGELARNAYVRTACETNTDFVHVPLGTPRHSWADYRTPAIHARCRCSCSFLDLIRYIVLHQSVIEAEQLTIDRYRCRLCSYEQRAVAHVARHPGHPGGLIGCTDPPVSRVTSLVRSLPPFKCIYDIH
jgi:hypothetical protein